MNCLMAVLNPELVLQNSFLDGLKPDPLLTVSEWSEEFRYLSQKASAEPGRWRNKRTPYLVEIMDHLSPSYKTQVVVFMKGAQVGATECGNNWIGHTIDLDPCPMLSVAPTGDTAKRNSRQRIAPLIEESPSLKKKVKDAKSRDSGNTVLSKEFTGGSIVFTGANSGSGLRSMPARKIFLDEVDAYPVDVDGEGDPVELAKARARTFARKKIFEVSTPTDEESSRINGEFQETDKRYYHVPCPHCKELQIIDWKRIKWEKGKESEAWLECEHCKEKIEEHNKTWMLANGKWIATNPEHNDPLVVGFHLSSLYSPLGWYSWGDAAKEFTKAKKDQTKLKAFINTVLGETWKQKSEVPSWKKLFLQRETYKNGTIPMGGLFLTAGVDIQLDRIEVQVRAWGRDHENWGIDYKVFYGETTLGAKVYDELDRYLLEEFEHESGVYLPIRVTAIDTGYNTQAVYAYCRKHPITRLIGVKGQKTLQTAIGRPSAVDVNIQGKKISRGFRLWPVGTDLIKSEVYGWLRGEKPVNEDDEYPSGYCHNPEWDEEYFKQLTAERIVQREHKGYIKFEWEKHRDRNEALDTFVYARAAASKIGIDRYKEKDWRKLENELGVMPNKKTVESTSNQQISASQLNTRQDNRERRQTRERRTRSGRF